MRPTDYKAGGPCIPVQQTWCETITPVPQTKHTNGVAADGALTTAVSAAALLDASSSSLDAWLPALSSVAVEVPVAAPGWLASAP